MADSPSNNASGILDFSFRINGIESSEIDLVRSIEIKQNINKICRAIITIEESDMETEGAKMSNKKDFAPGVRR